MMTIAKKRALVIIAALALVIGIGVTGTTAYLKGQTSEITNTFTPTEVTCEVEEKFTPGGTEKSDVKVKNTGTTDAFIRAMVVINFKDDEGNIAAVQPVEGTDYTITYASGSDWTKKGDFWYYTKSVAKGESTGILISKIETKSTEYKLDVQIIAQAVQNTNAAVSAAWGATANADGTVLTVN